MIDVLEIELLAHIIAKKRGGFCTNDCRQCHDSGSCIYRDIAEICINAGYRPVATVRVETVEEFMERLKKEAILYPGAVRAEVVDFIATEMTKGAEK